MPKVSKEYLENKKELFLQPALAVCKTKPLYEVTMKDIIMETSSIQAIKQLTISGMGITLLPRIAVEDELNRNLLVELDWAGTPFDLVTQMIYHKGKWVSPTLKAFLDLAKETMRPL